MNASHIFVHGMRDRMLRHAILMIAARMVHRFRVHVIAIVVEHVMRRYAAMEWGCRPIIIIGMLGLHASDGKTMNELFLSRFNYFSALKAIN